MPLVQTPINICHYSEIVHLLFTLMAFSEFRIQVHNIALQGNSSPNTVCYFPFVTGYGNGNSSPGHVTQALCQ